MAERFVEIHASMLLDGTLTSRWGFQSTGPNTRENLVFPRNLHVLEPGRRPNLSWETNELKQTKLQVELHSTVQVLKKKLLGCNSSEQKFLLGRSQADFLNKWLCLFTMKQSTTLL